MNGKENGLNPPVGELDHAEGTPGALITLVEYGDYECPHCGHAYPILKQLQERLGDQMRFVFRNFPLSQMHPHALAAAELAEAAALQGKFWATHDILFEHQDALDDERLSQYAISLHLILDELESAIMSNEPLEHVKADFKSGVRSGVNGTPTFFINGRRFEGDWTNEDEFIEALADAMQESD